MKRLLAAIGVVASLSLSTVPPALAATISLACGGAGKSLDLCKEGAVLWEQKTGHTVNVVVTPSGSNEQLTLYQQQLAAGASDIDVYRIDTVWPGILKSHFIDLTPHAKGIEKEHFKSIIENNTVEGKLLALPWYTDAGLLFYRKDLLEKYKLPVPTTWDALTDTAQKIQDGERAAGNDRMWGYVWQGRAYEGLSCNALEWIDSYGGELIDENEKIAVKSPATLKALTRAASWINTISPEGVLNYSEDESRGVFQSGNSVFMRNWPYAWALANSADSPVKDKVGVARLPAGGPEGHPSATLGGWQLAVSAYSKNPDVAADLVLFMTGKEEQKRRAVSGSYNPTYPALYEDPQILEANPFYAQFAEILPTAVARPARFLGTRYGRFSNTFWNGVHRILSKQDSAEKGLSDLERSLKRATP